MKKIIYFLLIAVITYFITDAIYTQINKTGAKSQRLACHSMSTVFERVYSHESLALIQDAIKAQNYDLVIKTNPSVYMESNLFKYLSKDMIRSVVENIISNHKKKTSSSKKILLDMLVYENDKKDPGKKTKKSKLYEGYVVLSFILDNQLIYKVQVDFMKPKAEDLGEKVECGIISLLTME